MRLALDRLVLVDRPSTTLDDAPVGTAGDTVEVHGVGGPVMAVDPISQKATTEIKTFVVTGAA